MITFKSLNFFLPLLLFAVACHAQSSKGDRQPLSLAWKVDELAKTHWMA